MSGVRLDVRSNMDRVVAEFRAEAATVQQATYRALNRALDQSATETSREIRKVYNVRDSAVKKALTKIRASRGRLYAVLRVEGAKINLIEFDARAVNPWNVKGRKRRPGGGVSVLIKKTEGRKLLAGAFITASTRNNARGGGSAGMNLVYKRRTSLRDSLRALQSVSIPQAFSNRAVIDAVSRLAQDAFDKNFVQQIRYLGGRDG